MPSAPTRKPPPQQQAAASPTARGPTRSSQRPPNAAESPRQTIATVKTQTTCERLQSPPALTTTPSIRVSGALKMLQA